VLENDCENVQDKPLAFDRLCVCPRLSNEGKLAVAIEGILPIGRDCSAVVQESPEICDDWWWKGVEPDEGGGREGEKGERVQRVGRLLPKLLPGRKVLVHG